jgi:hypothetical protein
MKLEMVETVGLKLRICNIVTLIAEYSKRIIPPSLTSLKS